jgi:transposase
MKHYSTTIGLDVSDKYSRYCVIDGCGEVVEEGRVRTAAEAMSRKFSSYEPSCIAMEVGTHSRWVSRLLEAMGHEVIVSNSRKLRMIYASDSKGDRADAEMLGRLGRSDPTLLCPIRHRAESSQLDLALIRSRDMVVRTRSNLINHVRGSVKAFGYRLPTCSAESFVNKVRGRIPKEALARLRAGS